MKNLKVFISRAIILTFVGLVLSGIILVDAAKADNITSLTGEPGAAEFGQHRANIQYFNHCYKQN